VLLDHLVDGAPAVLRRADVALVDAAFQPLLCELADKRLGHLAVAAVTDRHVRALFGEAVADRRPDAPVTAGDESDATLQTGTPDG
jgi:hypothetical protein